MAFVIGISGVSGAGKTVITKQIAENLQDAAPLFWDDFEDLGIFPDDYVEWFNSSRDYGAWKTPEFAGAIKTLKSDQAYKHPTSSLKINSKKYVVVDAPLGYKHKETGQHLDFVIFVEVPPDIALARRILRDDLVSSPKELKLELNTYLHSSRPVYLASCHDSGNADLIVDGMLPIEKIVQVIIKNVVKVHDKENK